MSFYPGQLVVYIKASGFELPGYGVEVGLIKGRVYTVRDMFWSNYFAREQLRVNEVHNPILDYLGDGLCECGFNPAHFRPITEDKLSIFRQHLAPSPKQTEDA